MDEFFLPCRKMFYYLMLRPQRDDKSQKYLSLYCVVALVLSLQCNYISVSITNSLMRAAGLTTSRISPSGSVTTTRFGKNSLEQRRRRSYNI